MDFVITQLSLKHLIYLILTTYVAFIACSLSPGQEAYWLIWTALFLALVGGGESFKKRLTVLLLTGCMIMALTFLVGCIAKSVTEAAVVVFIITLLSVYLAEKKRSYFYSFLLINLFTILALILPPNLTENIDRLLFIFEGMVIALFFQLIFVVHFNQDRLHFNLVLTLQHLKLLNRDIFNCFLDPEYAKNIYLFERRIHVQKFRALNYFCQLRNVGKLFKKKNPEDNKRMQSLLRQLEQILNLLQDISQLRRRVSDHTIFAVCREELGGLYQATNTIFDQMIKQCNNNDVSTPIQNEDLTEQVQRFDDIFTSVLQVTAREPLVFVLFISSLKALEEAFLDFWAELMKVEKIFV